MSALDANARYDTVIVMAHGSRHAPANEAHLALCEELAARLGETEIRPAFLELAEPLLPDVVADAVDRGSRRIAVLPYFLHPGNHTTRDIPELVASARAEHPDATIEPLAAFGSDPRVVDVLSDQIAREAGRATPS